VLGVPAVDDVMTTEGSPEAPPLESPVASWRMMVRSSSALAVGQAVAGWPVSPAAIWMTRRLTFDGFGVVSLGTNLVLWFGLVVNSSHAIGLCGAARTPERFKAMACQHMVPSAPCELRMAPIGSGRSRKRVIRGHSGTVATGPAVSRWGAGIERA
jgi:hypothetical protein